MLNTISTPSVAEANEVRVVYSVKEVSQLLHTNAALIYRFIELGLLPAIKLGSLRVRKPSTSFWSTMRDWISAIPKRFGASLRQVKDQWCRQLSAPHF